VSVVAAVDVGTNAARLLVVRDGVPIERRVVITRLGEDLSRTSRLSGPGLERTAAALRDFATVMRVHDVRDARAVTTAAARAAADTSELLDVASRSLGVPLGVLSAEEEARLTFRGAVDGRGSGDGPFLVVDVGGGSTELAVGTERPEAVVSIDLGSEHLTARELVSDPPRAEELSNAVSIVHDQLEDGLRTLPGAEDSRALIGVGGTITTIAAVELGRPVGGPEGEPVHGFFLSRDATEDVFRTLSGERLADRVHNPGLPPERAPIIVGGCCIVVGILRRLQAPGMVVSVRDLLDGVAAELA
jgi:exopolyphosphatase/guanosine-5'-triphosphate,3'-diphosphate pyrophosphatase